MPPFFSSISSLLKQDMDSKSIIFKALHDLSKEDELYFDVYLETKKQHIVK
jgi:hypothetical protein